MTYRIFTTILLLIGSLSFIQVKESIAQPCIPPMKQVVLYDTVGNYYVYWKPSSVTPINYKVQVMCIGLPSCFYSVVVTDTNVLKMNGGYLGIKIPPLPVLVSTVKLSIFGPDCPDQFVVAFVLSLDIITDNLDIAVANCDSDTCKLVVNKWTKLKKLTKYAKDKCEVAGPGISPSTVTAIDAPIDILLRKTATGNWQMKSVDTLVCDSCYVFNFQITCSDGSIHYVQDTICFNYTGPDLGCRIAGLLPEGVSIALYPNPVKEQCTIRLNLDEASKVSAVLYNSLGRQVRVIAADAPVDEGMNEIEVQLSGLPAGIYIVEIRVNNQVVRAMLSKL